MSRAHKRREGVRACNFDLFGNTQNHLCVLKIDSRSIFKDALCLHTYLAKLHEWQEVLYIVTHGRFCCSYSDNGELHALPPSLRLCAIGRCVIHYSLPLINNSHTCRVLLYTCRLSVSSPVPLPTPKSLNWEQLTMIFPELDLKRGIC